MPPDCALMYYPEGDRDSMVAFGCVVVIVAMVLTGGILVNCYEDSAPNSDVQFSLVPDPFRVPHIGARQRECRYGKVNNMSVPSNIRARTCYGYKHEIECTLDKRRKLLVLYMHTNSKGYTISTEYDNMRIFLANAVLAPNVSTKLYSSVDYVFTRISDEVVVPTVVSRTRDNVWFVHVPQKGTPCDLCAHGIVVDLLGIDLLAEYDSVLYMNSGGRGPYTHCDEHWMDIVTMAGSPSLPLLPDGSIDAQYRPSIAVGYQWIWGGYMESWFVMVPRPAFGIVKELWRNACAKGFSNCIHQAEMKLRDRIEGELNMPTYSTCQGTLMSAAVDYSSVSRAFTSSWRTRLTGRWAEPCKCIFIKFGGSTFRNRGFKPEYVDRVQKMTVSLVSPSLTSLYSPALVEPVQWLLG